ncbi:response regulator transcription factor [Nocardia carnea]|uniref:response regulator transcription factor n=1 Tax=Nocardia carnea TaxID=37328 RepID=UPI0024544E5B|nr:helix-turn-helix transcriptional regulator [Nocardia carnea]
MDSPVSPQVGDVLYLMATVDRVEGLTTPQLAALRLGSSALLRGDLAAALTGFDSVLSDPELTEQTLDQIAALRSLTASLAGRTSTVTDRDDPAGPALRAVQLCLRADRHWRIGELAEALWQNQLAENVAAEAGPVWHVFTRLMTAKRLVDMRITARAADLVARVRAEQERHGLYAFESIPVALEAAVCLQRDQPEAALRAAATAVECAHRHRTTVAVPRALAVAALAYLRLGDVARASEQLGRIRAQPDHFLLPDTVARAALIDIAVTAERRGSAAAAGLLRSSWPVIEAEPAGFVEDPAIPAFLTGLALRAGDALSAGRIAEAAEWLAQRNPGLPLLHDAASYARAVYREENRAPDSLFGVVADPCPPPGNGQPTSGSFEGGGVPAGLTAREGEVAGLVGQGMTNRQVARKVGITEHTVNFHLRKIYRKLDISSRAELIRRIATSG